MAWYTHQILADYLNRIENHTLIGKVLDDILAEDVVLTYGTQTYSGKAAVLGFFEDTSHAISSEFGFRATPVIICNTDDPEYNLSSDKLHTAEQFLILYVLQTEDMANQITFLASHGAETL